MGRFFLGIFMILMGGLLIRLFWWQDFDIEQQLNNRGIETDATVIKRDIYEYCPGEDSDCTTKYRVEYNFVAHNERWYKGTAFLPRALYDRLTIGSKPTVIYLADDPNLSRLEGEESSVEWLWLICGGVIILAGIFVSYSGIRS